MELLSGLIGVVIGGIITYYFSTRLLRKQLEAQQAYEFVSRNYLPLLSAVEQYKFAIVVCFEVEKADEDINEDSEGSLTEKDALGIYGESLKLLEEALERLVTSGMFLIIRNIDYDLGSHILGLQHHLKLFKMPKNISKVYPDLHIDKLGRMLPKLSIPDLVAEYQNVMKKGFKPKEGS